MTARELGDGVIILRPMTLADAEAHLAGEDELAARFLSGGRSTLASVKAFIERHQLIWESGGPERCFGIREAATGDLVGMVEAYLVFGGFRRGVANICYGLYPPARGRGYATRAVGLVLRYLVESTATEIAAIQIDPENHASLRVPPRLGFQPLGEYIDSDGRKMVFGRRLRPAAGELVLSDICE